MDASPFERRLAEDGAPALLRRAFVRALEGLARGERGFVAARELAEVGALPNARELSARDARAGEAALSRAVHIKLNGGLGASMGLAAPKALLKVRGEQSFLDLFARAHLALCARTGVRVPLVLMNSRATQDAALAALAKHGELSGALPASFLQHRVPRIDAQTLAPASCPEAPAREWCPPGHGDLYAALAGSGMLKALRRARVRYAFISNADNLGATLDPSLLGWFAQSGAPFAMEVKARTPADRKGGHLARARDGRLLLRELAQCPPDELEQFQDTRRHRFFNTNNLWLDLAALEEKLAHEDGLLALPVMCTRRALSPARADEVLQLETAAGAGISLFEGARAIEVPAARFLPVKSTGDLLLLRSDAFAVSEAGALVLKAKTRPLVSLGSHFKKLADFERRFAHGAPSLVNCKSLRVTGDVTFGARITLTGEVNIKARASETLHIESGTKF